MLRLLAGALASALLLGCSVPTDQLMSGFHKALVLHFSNLNNDAALSKIDSKMQRPYDYVTPSAGMQYNSYAFDPKGAVLQDVPCRYCSTRHLIVSYTGTQVQCSACGSRDPRGGVGAPLVRGKMEPDQLQQEFGERYKPMFEVVGNPGARSSQIVAIVRYVRRNWSMDPQARVAVSTLEQKDAGNELVKTVRSFEEAKSSGANYFGGGFHRADTTYLSTTAFVFDGSLSQVDLASVEKLLEGRPLDEVKKSWSLGPALSKEEPVRPWNAPRTLAAPNARAR